MAIGNKVVNAITAVAQVCVLIMIVALVQTGASVKAAGSIHITGSVYAQNGNNLQDISVTAVSTANPTAVFGPVKTDSSGSYRLQIEAGTYDFHFDTPDGSSLIPATADNVTVLNTQTLNKQLSFRTHTFSGHLTDQKGAPFSEMAVHISGKEGYMYAQDVTDLNGYFNLIAPAEMYTHLDISNNSTNYQIGGYPLGLMQIQNDNSKPLTLDLTTASLTQDLTINLVKMTIIPKDSTGNSRSDVKVSYGSYSGQVNVDAGNTTYPLNYIGSFANSGITDTSGAFTSLVPKGIVFYPCRISALKPDLTFDSCADTTVVPSDDTTVIIHPWLPLLPAPANLTASSPTTEQPVLTWEAVPGAVSYGIYRDGFIVGATMTNSFTDTTAATSTHQYRVAAYNSGGESNWSNIVHVSVILDDTPPTITYLTTPRPNSEGWNNSTSTITFACSDDSSGIRSCSRPQTESIDGKYILTGTAIDKAGNITTTDVSVNIDTTAPTINDPAMTPSVVIGGQSSILQANITDDLSGAATAEYFEGTDPGQGQGTSMSVIDSTATSKIKGSSAGVHTLSIRAQDKAGNWSAARTIQLNVKPSSSINLIATSPINTPKLTWDAVAGTNHYDVYRDGIKVGSPNRALYTDNKVVEGSHSYYIVAITANNVASDQSNAVTVFVDKSSPRLSYTTSSTPNSKGWNKSNVAITFTCSDALSGIDFCNNPITISTEGPSQRATGIAIDKAGNQKRVIVVVQLDKTAPTANQATMSNTVILFQAKEIISAKVSDVLSGVAGGEYYIDTDPGQGNGTIMTYSKSKITATTIINTHSGLQIGRHTLYIRAKDKAGNWSVVSSKTFVYI